MAPRRFPLGTLTVALLFTALPPGVFAAEQGDISDTTSTGTLDLTLEVPPLVRISDLEDIDLGTFDGVSMSGADDVCVWSTTRAYTITASGDGGSFTLTGGTSGDTLAYSVEWAESAGATSGVQLASGAALTGRTTTATSASCNGGNTPNAAVIVEVGDGDLAAAPADTYTGTLTLVVAPE
jgi:hypothetical protein